MASNIITSNLNMKLPIPGVTGALGVAAAGESWMELQNTAFQTIDAHDHSPGRGSPIASAGIGINADLDMVAYNLIRARSVRFEGHAATSEVNLSADCQCVFFSGGEMYVRDASGNAIQMTAAGAVNVSAAGGWTGMGATTALATYTVGSKLFQLLSNTGIWGDLNVANIGIGQHGLSDAGAAAGGFKVRLKAGALAADYDLTFPTVLPNPVSAETALAADDGATIKTRGLFAKQDGTLVWGQTGTSQLADVAVTEAKLATSAVTTTKIGAGQVKRANLETWTTGAQGVGTANIEDAAITTNKILDLNVTTGKLADNAVTSAKLYAALWKAASIPSSITVNNTTKVDILSFSIPTVVAKCWMRVHLMLKFSGWGDINLGFKLSGGPTILRSRLWPQFVGDITPDAGIDAGMLFGAYVISAANVLNGSGAVKLDVGFLPSTTGVVQLQAWVTGGTPSQLIESCFLEWSTG